MKCYKLTDEFSKTKNNTLWGKNISHTAVGDINNNLCSDAWIHWYKNPLIAVLMNPVHANFDSPILWEAESSGKEIHEPFKSGSRTLTTLIPIELPHVTLIQKIAFGVLCVKQVCFVPEWNIWADRWLSGEDRSETSAYAASDTAYAASNAASNTAAYAAAYAASNTSASNTAYAASNAAAYAADAADIAASNADYPNPFLNIEQEAMKY